MLRLRMSDMCISQWRCGLYQLYVLTFDLVKPCRGENTGNSLQGLYLLLVTNKASNILEDLETLRLLSKVVPEYITSLEEEAVSKSAFDLLFAFDEVRQLNISL